MVIPDSTIWKAPYTKEQLQEAIKNQVPIVGANGNWWRWNVQNMEWDDTQVKADGTNADGTASRPNLLRNWYFADPINQRGLTEYSGDRYVMDGWHCVKVNEAYTALVQLNDEFITVTSNASGTKAYILQNIEVSQFQQLVGKQVTISCLARLPEGSTVDFYSIFYADGILNAVADMSPLPLANGEWHCFSLTGVVSEKAAAATSAELTFRVKSGSIDIKAVKLELGATQTLAHQDENGEWVLNDPPPDKNIELLKCCMSTADSSDTYANNKVTPAAVGAVNKAGDTMTGNLIMKNVTVNDGVNNQTVLTAYDDEDGYNYGCELVISGNGNTFVGAGESAKNLRNTFINGGDLVGLETWEQNGEKLYISTDNDIFFETGCQTIANRKCFIFYRTGSFYSPSGMVWGGKGSYTGNGSSTTRTIKIGNGGNCLMVWNTNNDVLAIVMPTGCVVKYNGSGSYALSSSQINCTNGVLTIATTNCYLNDNGYTYNYILLG